MKTAHAEVTEAFERYLDTLEPPTSSRNRQALRRSDEPVTKSPGVASRKMTVRNNSLQRTHHPEDARRYAG